MWIPRLPPVVGLQRGRYFARNPLTYFFLRLIDAGSIMLRSTSATSKSCVQRPARILLCNASHLGDMMLALTILSPIKRLWPDVEIGVLAGRWSGPLLEGHPGISYVHYVDHWKLNRSSHSAWTKICKYFSMRRKAIKDIRALDYDVAVDLYCFFPNAAMLLFESGIPTRIGYSSGGLGPLYTHAVDWSPKNQSMVKYHLDLLGLLNPYFSNAIPDPHWGVLAAMTERFQDVGDESACLPAAEYIVLHPGTGDPMKEWPMKSWRELLWQLKEEGHRLVISGSGAGECVRANQISSGFDGITNLCGQLAWPEFVRLVRGAKMLVGVDSVAGHVAAAVGTPCVVIATGVNNPHLWKPLGDKCEYLVADLPCAPCYQKRGCESMECIRRITPKCVSVAITSLIESGIGKKIILQATFESGPQAREVV